MEINYYIKNEKNLIKDFKRLIKKNKIVLERYYEYKTVEDIVNISVKNYQELIPQIPYIGGRDNHLTEMLVGSAQLLALIIALQDKSESIERIGEIVYKIVENLMKSVNPVLLFFARIMFLSKMRLRKMKKAALKSQEKKYAEDWVYEIIEGNDEDFIFGNTYSECGICKFYKKLGYEKYVPYLCITDYVKLKSLNIKLDRSKTIGNGDKICDFKFIRNQKPIEGWPPDKLLEFKV